MEEEFGRTKLAVVIKAHRMAVSPGVMDDQDVAVYDFRQAAVDGKFIAVFAKGADDVVE